MRTEPQAAVNSASAAMARHCILMQQRMCQPASAFQPSRYEDEPLDGDAGAPVIARGGAPEDDLELGAEHVSRGELEALGHGDERVARQVGLGADGLDSEQLVIRI